MYVYVYVYIYIERERERKRERPEFSYPKDLGPKFALRGCGYAGCHV